jgi:hypothetical protein
MLEERQVWKKWAATLQKWGARDFAATFLEALGPAQTVGAQLIYIGQPLLNSFLPATHLTELANILEQPETQKEFVDFLRDEDEIL